LRLTRSTAVGDVREHTGVGAMGLTGGGLTAVGSMQLIMKRHLQIVVLLVLLKLELGELQFVLVLEIAVFLMVVILKKR